MPAKLLLALFLSLPAAAAPNADPFGKETDAPVVAARYTPPSRAFICEVPKGWTVFEEDEGPGTVVHMLGPENPAGTYRSGLDVRYFEKGQPGFKNFKKALEDLRRSDEDIQRTATSIRGLRTGAGLARTFEITETRRLPPDRLPSLEEALHRYVAVIPAGDSYYVVSLSSSRDTYLDFRDLFVEFLRTFFPH